jgi:Spy/CpxP family protein refolding chaperone
MKILKLAAVAAVAFTSLGLSAAPAAAQDRHDNDRDHHHGWHHRGHQVCHWYGHGRHRHRECHWAR